MNSFVVDPADPSDHQRLSEIALESKRHWGYPEKWITEWKDELTISTEYILTNKVFKLIDSSNNLVCGFCALVLDLEKEEVEVEHLWLLSSYIGQDLGKYLLQSCLDNISDNRIKRARVTSDPNALVFYRKFGFVEVGYTESSPIGRVLPNLEMELV
jgi:N-acetylglutamate synthase-like GNAT family acetyltransferase